MSTRIKTKQYRQLDGSMKTQVSKVGEGILRRFDKTEIPVKDDEIYCPHFMLLAWANGCFGNCSFCFLQGTFRYDLIKVKASGEEPMGVPPKFKDRERIAKELEAFVAAKELPPEILDTGELSDSLLDEGKRLPTTFSEFIMSYILGTKHKVLFLSKMTCINKFLQYDWQKNAILAWSLNAPEVADRWEQRNPGTLQRLDAAKKVYDAGYEVRLRIDPMIPVENWKEQYGLLVDEIYKRLKPSTITLGTLRGLQTTMIYAWDKSWVPYLTEKSNWGKKMPHQQRLEMYQFVTDKIRSYDLKVNIGICKETLGMHKALVSDPAKMHCNCIW